MRRRLVGRSLGLIVVLALAAYALDVSCYLDCCLEDRDCCATCHAPMHLVDRPDRSLALKAAPELPVAPSQSLSAVPPLPVVEAAVLEGEGAPRAAPCLPVGTVRGPPAGSSLPAAT